MRQNKVFIIIAFMLMTFSAAAGTLTSYVNPFIGTGGHGHVFLGANVPFGLVQLGPTEPTRGWDWCSGYHITDNDVIGFGHTHLSGTGIGDLGDIGILPVKSTEERYVYIDHTKESCIPGYYSVMTDDGVKVELTATSHCGMHKYTFPAGTKPLIRLDLKQGIGWDKMTQCHFTQISPTFITGYRYSTGWAVDQRIYFIAEFNRPVTLLTQQGDSVAYFQADNLNDSSLLIRVGISANSITAAKNNLSHEINTWDFTAIKDKADEAWENELKKITIETDNDDDRTIFYTCMYHFMFAPSEFSDYGAEHKVYTTFSLWDTYRAAMPLTSLIESERETDLSRTFLDIYEEQGRLPMWHLWGNETDCMVGNPGVPILADMVLKGFCKDKEEAFRAMKATAMADGRGLTQLREYGYIPYDKDSTNETVAKGLEYAIADGCIAKVAKDLGKTEDYNYFEKRSQSYKKYFDKSILFMRGIDSKGNFRPEFDAFKSIHRMNDYTEGNAWQYTFLVPHDVHGLVSLFPSEKRFTNKLDSLFIAKGDLGDEASPDISGLIGQYAHGNEPSHHIIYMYNYVGQPWKSARLLRQVYKEMYRNDFDGLCGNEDVGQMSAWYILSTCGLYQVEPAGGKYIIGSPLFKKASLNVGNGKTFTILANNNSGKNIYIQKALLNGKPYHKSYISYQEIRNGGTLELYMGAKPSKLGTAVKDRP